MKAPKRGLAVACLSCALIAHAQTPRFLTFAEAQETLAAFGRGDDAASWDAWIRAQDREVRERVDRGVEDSISNLIVYGKSFTQLPALDSAEAAIDTGGSLTEPARARVRAAVSSMERSDANERLRFARDFLARRGVQVKDAGSVLSSNLVRFAKEQREYEAKLKAAAASGPQETLFVRATLYAQRGLSVDTSLVPDFALEDSLAAMIRKQAIHAGSIHRIAIVGPGLDFADKRDGYDFYPVQTIQPFAVMEAVIRLGLADSEGPTVTAFDLNPAVIAHLHQMAVKARAGAPYVVNLPHEQATGWTPQFTDYWEHFGDRIASPATPVHAPKGVAIRAVAVQPQYASRIEARDLNVVGQVVDGEHFDLVIATNILLYYDRFQQVIAMNGIARMMSPGGVFLSNTVLPAERPNELEYLGRRSVAYTASGSYGDDIVVYRRK